MVALFETLQLRHGIGIAAKVRVRLALLAIVVSAFSMLSPATAGDPALGYQLLTEKAYLPSDFDTETFDQIYKAWPEPLRKQAEAASADERRQMAFERYGLSRRDGDGFLPLQYVVDDAGQWSLNCFACHGGTLLGETYPGLPNRDLELETLTEEVRLTKMLIGKPLSGMDVGALLMPLGTTRGTTNAVNFGIVLMAYRDADLNVYRDRPRPPMVHHDMDAPPWWHFKKKPKIYCDGYADKGARGLMQMLMVPENGPDDFRSWESDFEHVYAFLQSVEPPPYPFDVDRALAQRGEIAFETHCARCHGNYGNDESYPGVSIPVSDIGTDPVRLTELKPHHRDSYGDSWFAYYGQHETIRDPQGYVAPPLDGIWATAPYFHNGSVPTLWHVLRPEKRPKTWKRVDPYRFNEEQVGLTFETLDKLPKTLSNHQRRQIFDTTKLGKSAAGHNYPDLLDDDEKRAVLEYLKTL